MRDFNKYLEYIYQLAPSYQSVGAPAYKEGLTNTLLLDEHFGHPHRFYKTIHIAGTNGKGSCSHTIASILQQQGYRVGLYTSPHLLSFTERIRINGQPIPETYILDFVDNEKEFFEPLHTSFFELTTSIALRYFADEDVDYAVIEVGLGGRLDCTNIITPILSVITNISKDHTQHLGNTIQAIAQEKAGIMKPMIPCVIGEITDETLPIFTEHARKTKTPIVFAEQENFDMMSLQQEYALTGLYQQKNLRTIMTAVNTLKQQGVRIDDSSIHIGLQKVTDNTHLRGRWETLSHSPLTICDTGHNVGGIKYVVKQLNTLTHPILTTQGTIKKRLRFVFGVVKDKDISGILSILPTDALYYFTQASVPRAYSATELMHDASLFGLHGKAYSTVQEAVSTAQKDSSPEDLIFIGGSTFVVADAIKYF